jgi:hypothetical protein
MATLCTVCRHPELEAINGALRAREPLRAIAARFGASRAALDRHCRHHLSTGQSRERDGPAVQPLSTAVGTRLCADCREPYDDDGSNFRCRACIDRRNASTCLRAP